MGRRKVILKKVIYLIGSLRNPKIVSIGNKLRELGYEAFDSWWAAGYEADDKWQEYSKSRNLTYEEALQDYSAQHVFNFDKTHLERCDIGVLVMPAGSSGHLEFGYLIGKGKPGYILFEKKPARFEIMHNFATQIFFNVESLHKCLKNSL